MALKQRDRRLVGVTVAGEYAGLSPWTLRRRAYDGRLTSYKIGTRLLFDIADLDQLIDSGKRPALNPAAQLKAADAA